jgi:hypothetical protein
VKSIVTTVIFFALFGGMLALSLLGGTLAVIAAALSLLVLIAFAWALSSLGYAVVCVVVLTVAIEVARHFTSHVSVRAYLPSAIVEASFLTFLALAARRRTAPVV